MQILYCDPSIIDRQNPRGENLVTANTHEEYAAHRAIILDPSCGITLIDPKTNEAATPERILEILPVEPDPKWFLDYFADLQAIDAMSVRPLRAIMSGVGTDEDKIRLSELEAEAANIRMKLNNIK